MKKATTRALLLGAAGWLAASLPAAAGAFYGWQVTNVPAWDVLNVRAAPARTPTSWSAIPTARPSA